MDAQMVAIAGSNRPKVLQAKLVGESDRKQRIKVSIYARPNPRAAAKAAALVEQLSGEIPAKRRYLAGDEFDAVYGADPAELDQIAAWAQASKLTVLDRSISKRRVLVEGTIGDINAAFGIQLNEYEHAKTGRYRGREGSVHVPAALSEVVDGVFGLDTRRVGRSRRRRGRAMPVEWEAFKAASGAGKGPGPVSLASLANHWPGTFFPTQVAQLYNYPKADGSNQNVAIFAFNGAADGDPRGGYKLAALKTYFEQVLGGTTPSITDVVVQGPGNDPGPDTQASSNNGDSTGEVMLDMCVVGSVAPAAKIFVYFTEFTSQGWVDALHEAITDNNQIAVISISYGNPEDDPQGAWTAMGVKAVNQAFQAAIAKGITICVASGDDGSSDQESSGAHVDFPASSPYVLAVGGTKLVAQGGANPTITSETVWNEMLLQEGAGGGGISAVFSKPAYQSSVSVPPSVTPPHRIGRGVPDVAAVADPQTGVVVMHITGKRLEPIGGTSASAPLWAALIARINQALKARCGFVTPVLYAKCANGVLRDITVGNNGAYSAGPGWDACTGLGSPQGQQLLKALSK